MSKIDNGGPAFPLKLTDTYEDGLPKEVRVFPGMSLRDWFAGQALAGTIAASDYDNNNYATVSAAEAYEIADAMLAERAKAEGRE